MNTDRRNLPLAPLTDQSTDPLGLPETWIVERPGALDIEIKGWQIGQGEIAFSEMTSRRGTTVTIWLTTTGRLVTIKRAWTIAADGNSQEQESATHETPARAYAWLVANGKGKLGRASKAAWVRACQTFAPMSGMEIEREE